MLLFDIGCAVIIHHRRTVRTGKAQLQGIEEALQSFDKSFSTLRQVAADAVSELGNTSDRLTAAAEAASAQTNTASKAASATAEDVLATASSTGQLSRSIQEIHGQATHSAGMAHEAISQA